MNHSLILLKFLLSLSVTSIKNIIAFSPNNIQRSSGILQQYTIYGMKGQKTTMALSSQGESSDENERPQYFGNFFDEINDLDDDDDEDELPPNLEDEFAEYIPKINSVTLVGRVGNDPEPRYFNDNKVVLRLSLAVKRKYHPLERQVRNIKSGEEETDWFNLELWGRDAEYAGTFSVLFLILVFGLREL